MNNKPLVSIIMPAYNIEKYIVESIDSVINQTYSNWELLVVDDCSTDDTKKIIQEKALNDNRIKPIYLDINGGKPSICKNYAIKNIMGKYVAFLDSDDAWLSKKLEKQVEMMENNDYSLCYTGGYLIDENSKQIGMFVPYYNNGYIFNKQLIKYEINNQSVLIKSSLIIPLNETLTIGEDYNFFMRIILNFPICNIKEKLVKYRVHNKSITKQKTKKLSEGTLYTLSELNREYNILRKYPFAYFICWINAIKFKFFY